MSSSKRFFRWACLFEAGLAVLAWSLSWLFSVPLLSMTHWSARAVIWGVVASLPPLCLVIGGVHFSVGPLVRLVQVVEELLLPWFQSATIFELALISALAGLGEEWLFRGLIQHQIAAYTGLWVGLLAASILFGLLHAITFEYAVMATIIGLYLGGLWLITGNLLVPILTHAVYDWVILMYLIKIRGPAAFSQKW